jgi:hypothetical protein
MKKCSYCGLENSDEATHCVTCQTDLNPPPKSTALPARPVTPLDEQRFWERMTFRQFAALFLRLQALWLLWYAALDLIYIPEYVGHSYTGGIYLTAGAYRWILRLILHVAAAIAVIQYAEKIISWLVRDWIRNQPSETTPEPPAAVSSISNRPATPKPGD